MIPPAQNPYASMGIQTSAQYYNYDNSPTDEMRYSNERRDEDDAYYDNMERQQMRGYEEQPEEEYDDEEYEDSYEDESNEMNEDYESKPPMMDNMGFSHDIISGELINYDSPYSNNSFEDRRIIDTDGNMGDYWSVDNLIGDLSGFQKGGNKSSVDASFGLSEDIFGSGVFNREARGIQNQSFNEIFGGQDMGVDPQTMYGERFDAFKAKIGEGISKVGSSFATVKNLPHAIAEKWHEGKGDLKEWNDKQSQKSSSDNNSSKINSSKILDTLSSDSVSKIGSSLKKTVEKISKGDSDSSTKKDPELEKTEKKIKEQEEEIEKLKQTNRDAYIQSRRRLGFGLNTLDDDDFLMRHRIGGSAGSIEIGMRERTGEDLFGHLGGSSSDDDEDNDGEMDFAGIRVPSKSSDKSNNPPEMIQGDVFGFKGMGNYGEAEDMFGKSIGGTKQDFGDIFGNFGVDNNAGGRPMGFSEMFGFSIGSQSDEPSQLQPQQANVNPNVRTSLTSLNVKQEKKQFKPVKVTPSTGNRNNRKQPIQQQYQPRAQVKQPQAEVVQQPEMRGYRRNFFENNADYSGRFAMNDSTYAFDVGGNLGFDYSNQSPDVLGVEDMLGFGGSRITSYNPTTKTMTITTKKGGKVHKTTKKLSKKTTKSTKKTTKKPTTKKQSVKKQTNKSQKDDDVLRSLIWG